MASFEIASWESAAYDIKSVPQEQSVREAIRARAEALGPQMDRSRPLSAAELEQYARAILRQEHQPEAYLGFVMVAINNVFWQRQFESIPFERRLFLLPKCLSSAKDCRGLLSSEGLNCKHCGACSITDFVSAAETLGYQIAVAEGTPSVVMKIMDGKADAIFGVACLDSLEKAFKHVVELGIPHMAVPLLTDGCVDTTVEADQILRYLTARRDATTDHTRSYVPLLRETVRTFEKDALGRAILPYLSGDANKNGSHPLPQTEAILLEWLEAGGKRLRPFVTIAAYAVGKHGEKVLEPDAELDGLIPQAVKKVAMAIEALHKASLVHDDIEDDDKFRYGKQTLHREHGVGPALNVGDYLVGLGYRLIADEVSELGAACVADIIANLSNAHIELCRGQGGELLWHQSGRTLKPIDALSIYALKTAPAFETALFAGLRAADADIPPGVLKRFSNFVGEGYQVLNDLDDWRQDQRNKVTLGQDVLAQRPTVLRAFAIEAGGAEKLQQIGASAGDAATIAADVKKLYTELSVFAKAEKLLKKLRNRAESVADEIEDAALKNLLHFLVKIVL